MTDITLNDKGARLSFGDLGYPLPIEQRPLWRLSLMCLAIKYFGRADTGINLIKLRVATWMLIRSKRWQEYLDYAFNPAAKCQSIGSDDYTEKAIRLGIEKQLFELSGPHNLILLPNGESLIGLCREVNAFDDEISFMEMIKSKFTSEFIKGIAG